MHRKKYLTIAIVVALFASSIPLLTIGRSKDPSTGGSGTQAPDWKQSYISENWYNTNTPIFVNCPNANPYPGASSNTCPTLTSTSTTNPSHYAKITVEDLEWTGTDKTRVYCRSGYNT